MNKKELKKYLDNLGLDKKEYCIISGGSLLMHNIKEETDDVDLYVTKEGLDKLKQSFPVQISGKPYPNHYTVNEHTEVVVVPSLENETIYFIDSYPCRNLIDDYQWYKNSSRPKDLISVEKIEKLFEKIAKEYHCKIEEITENEICKYLNQ